MAKKTKLQLSTHEASVLRVLYRHHGVPIDQFLKRPTFSDQFLATWNEATGRLDSIGDLLHYMITERKNGNWVRFDGAHRVSPVWNGTSLSPDEWSVVCDEYLDVSVGSDNFAFDESLVATIQQRLVEVFDRHIPASTLIAEIVQRRKDRLLPKLHKSDGGSSATGRGSKKVDDD